MATKDETLKVNENQEEQLDESKKIEEDDNGPTLAFDEYRAPFKREAPKVGRNAPCPCGSGKKHKKCCLNK